MDVYRSIQEAYVAHALFVLTKRRVFDSLMRPSTLAELAARCRMDGGALEPLLRLAVCKGLVVQDGDRFRIDEKGYPLTRFSRSWIRSYLLLWGEQLNSAFANLDDWATRGSNAFELAHGAKLWDFYRNNRSANDRFVEFMDLVSDQGHIPVILRNLEVAGAEEIVDVGGGRG